MSVGSGFDRVKYSADAYVKTYGHGERDLGEILSSAVGKYGREVLLDPIELSGAMKELGARELDIFKVCMMLEVPGVEQLLNDDRRTEQLDLDRYIMNAETKTGFTRDSVLYLSSCIAGAAGIWLDCQSTRAGGNGLPESGVASLLYAIWYREELARFEVALERLVRGGGGDVILDFQRLELLVNLGIPRAKYCLGYCLLNGLQLERNEDRGLSLLAEAEAAGDSRAAAALGDYYYGDGGARSWSLAYEYYTGYGALALNDARKGALVNILNQRSYNKRTLAMSAVLVFATLLTLVFAPAEALFQPHTVLGIAVLALQVVFFVLTVLRFRARPFDRLSILPVLMAGLWAAYIAVRLLF